MVLKENKTLPVSTFSYDEGGITDLKMKGLYPEDIIRSHMRGMSGENGEMSGPGNNKPQSGGEGGGMGDHHKMILYCQ